MATAPFVPLQLQQRGHDLGRVFRQRRRHARQVELVQVAGEKQFLPAEEDLAVGRLRRQRRVVQRKQQRVVKRHPAEARRLLTRGPGRRGSPARLSMPKLVEHPVGIVVALTLLHLLLRRQQLFHVLGLGVVVLIAEHRLPCLDVDRIVLAEHQSRGGRLQRIAGQRVVVVVRLAVHCPAPADGSGCRWP